ncbi:MAG: T9SS type A sorting domain-containing protein [bacterium]|nr:T9SS type A sorting domain-containing protein [bacterium]
MVPFRFLFTLLLLITLVTCAMAQPQAPIVWGQPVQINTYPTFDDTWVVYSKGDTLVNIGTYWTRWIEVVKVSISVNNGATWRPTTHLVDSTMNDNNLIGANWRVCYTDQTLYICSALNASVVGLWSSVDWGLTWRCTRIPVPIGFLRMDDNIGDTLFFVQQDYNHGNTRYYYTHTVGTSGVLAQPILLPKPFLLSTSHNKINFIHNSSYVYEPNDIGSRLYFAQLNRATGTLLATRQLNTDLYWNVGTHGEIRDDGYGFFCSGTDSLPTQFIQDYVRITINNTTDGGRTFSRQYLTEYASARENTIYGWKEKYVVLTWLDSTVQATNTRAAFWAAFSANRGQSFYPGKQLVNGMAGFYNTDVRSIEIRPLEHRIRINYVRGMIGADIFNYSMVGTFTPDSVLPSLDSVWSLPLDCATNERINLRASARDNDSLWRVCLVVRPLDSQDSQVVTLTRINEHLFEGEWLAPDTSTTLTHYYFNEDMWENRGFYTTLTPLHPDTITVVSSDVTESNPLVSEFGVSIHPNPFNHSTTITATLPLGSSDAVITIHDILGREVYRSQPLHRDASNNISLIWNTHTSNASGQSKVPLSSGIYFVQLRAGSYHTITKITLLQ